jgi:hypothetical protein
MNKQRLFLFLLFLQLVSKSTSQDFKISIQKPEFDGRQLLISYDIVNNNQADQFYVWVEMEKKNGEPIRMKSLSGDVGDNIKAGTNKKIFWVPAKDSILLNEEVNVEVKAEKYTKSFNKGSVMLMSAVIPGLGQTKISKGKPWWLIGVVAYGALAGGFIANSSSLKTYDSYKIEEDGLKRKDLYSQAQNQKNISNVLIVSGVAIWTVNIIWVALIPNEFQPLQHLKLSFDQSTFPYSRTTLLTLQFNF